MTDTPQTDFLEDLKARTDHEVRFNEWFQSRGAKWILNRCIRWSWVFKRDYPQRNIGFKAVWEFVRSDIQVHRAKCKARGYVIDDVASYALNNCFTAYMVREVVKREPRLDGYFRLGTVGEQRRKTVIIMEPKRKEAAA